MTPKNNRKQRALVAKIKATQASTLMEVVDALLSDLSRMRRKQFLKNRCVTLRGVPTEQFDAPVKNGDEVRVYNIGFPAEFTSPYASIVWKDDELILLHKKRGIATVSNHPGLKNTLFRLVANYVKSYDPHEKIFLLNRLDSETEGLILFARSRETQQLILSSWRKFFIDQRFCAVVEGLFEKPEGELKGVVKNKSEVQTSSQKPLTRRSKTTYKVIKEGEYSTFVEIVLHGRFNGIRTLLKEESMPVVGENIPTAIFQNSKELLLQQASLTFIHPHTLRKMHFQLPIPASFQAFVKRPMTRGEKKRAMEQQPAIPPQYSRNKKEN